jgi:hypothetical protein
VSYFFAPFVQEQKMHACLVSSLLASEGTFDRDEQTVAFLSRGRGFAS